MAPCLSICVLRLWRISDGPAVACDITRPALQIRYKDEDGYYVNLNDDDTDNFQEMLVRASLVDEGLYIYIGKYF